MCFSTLDEAAAHAADELPEVLRSVLNERCHALSCFNADFCENWR